MAITLKELAKLADVSITAVSLVINNKPCRVSEATREKIQQLAMEHGYRVNLNARSLVTKKSMVIGLIIPDIENPFFSSLCKNIEKYARNHAYSTILVNSNDDCEQDVELIKLLISRGVDGLLIVLSNESLDDSEKMNEFLKTIQIPFVLVDRYHDAFHCNAVYFNNQQGAFSAITEFVAHNHKKIALIGTKFNRKNGLSRIEGYKFAMEYYGLFFDDTYILDGKYRFDGGYRCAKEILEQNFSAVLISNDTMTLGFMDYTRDHEYHVPEDISVISFDDTLSLRAQHGNMTSIHQDIEKLSIESVNMLMKHINDKDAAIQQVVLLPELIQRKSVRDIAVEEV